MAKRMFTPEELAELALADAEIEETFCLSNEDIRASRSRDKEALFDRKDVRQRKIAENQRAYREANREKIAENQRAYREANREKIAENKRAYYEANREKIAENQRAYREANREKINNYAREYMRKRRAAAV